MGEAFETVWCCCVKHCSLVFWAGTTPEHQLNNGSASESWSWKHPCAKHTGIFLLRSGELPAKQGEDSEGKSFEALPEGITPYFLFDLAS